MIEEIFFKSAHELSAMLSRREVSSVELTKAIIERTKQLDSKIGSFLSFDEGKTLKEAAESDARRKRGGGGALSPLDGIPVSLKDLVAEKGQPLTCGSKILENFISPYDATVTERLRGAGCVLWGRLNMDEFAMGSSSENSAYRAVFNPWNINYVPGGSSGGSAASVAAGETILALGSDTGGSIRQPAAFCGICGLKPSYGAVSRYGLVAFASSLDQIGPMGRSVEDIASLFQVIAGTDKKDSSTFHFKKPDYLGELPKFQFLQKLGVPVEYFQDGLDPEVRAALERAIEFYRSAGHEVVEVSLEMTKYVMPAYYVISTAEASSNLARFDGIRYGFRSKAAKNAIDIYSKTRGEGFGEEVKRRIMLGTYVLSSENFESYYRHAQKVRTLIRDDFMRAMEGVSALIAPTTPTVAFELGKKKLDPLQMYLCDIFTVQANMVGTCAISIPCGMSSTNLPIGMQILGKPFKEQEILSLAYEFESAHGYKDLHPNI
ncbi:MAG: Asp-tRNA(Asn)/Glu-tRNA(Gln) amidotransferase subunit GatA [Puniceicoccales bacterium]|jgi:aspartyl-tRNA(Asn)/glutamyl-tRNA(Gln) amidotransferase subunit A|nr:Asp-tRNA(Asn)/Glu-tRNA(Gln) amidotransferase subunit GatA [Puniceicoccales bacterium]